MGETMRPIPFDRLLQWMAGEYGKQRSIFGIPESCFFRKRNSAVTRICGESCDTPLGPAAGPHTQLAQNIVAAYLVGGRFIELKTVQKLDALKIEKPCIDARDEGYNTEWSTELSLEEAFDEYLKAWVLLHILERAFDFAQDGCPVLHLQPERRLRPRRDKDREDAGVHQWLDGCLATPAL